MTALRPERESGAYGDAGEHGSSYGRQPYEAAGAFEVPGAFEQRGAFAAAVEQLADPLNDPLPGAGPPGHPAYEGGQGAYTEPASPVQQTGYYPSYEQPVPAPPYTGQVPAPRSQPYTEPVAAPVRPPHDQPVPVAPPLDDRTVALRATDVAEARRMADGVASGAGSSPISASGGRAARRKAARRQGRHGGAQEAPEGPSGASEAPGAADGAPRSRMEARRAARASRPGAGVLVSRMVGEVFITTGVLMLLFVTYQLWWSNVRAHQQAGSETSHLQQDWASGKRKPGAFEPGQGFAILDIPKLDVVAPIAEGTSKTKVLDRGMVGHYAEGATKTAMPDAKTGNFGLAGHRNTHGEPFRYINRLKPGDAIVVETQDTYFVYKMTSILPVTPPSNTSVLDPIPPGSGLTKPGRYITLTTCTPEFTSKYRMIVWGKMVEERPRSKGKPDALVE
ncbi:class E sortase [Streptomyces avermitilis]|uniref:class E sortase n=1 Tax=Streptomyces avermitilis TaxID=33903 RepID=UPI0033B634B8